MREIRYTLNEALKFTAAIVIGDVELILIALNFGNLVALGRFSHIFSATSENVDIDIRFLNDDFCSFYIYDNVIFSTSIYTVTVYERIK